MADPHAKAADDAFADAREKLIQEIERQVGNVGTGDGERTLDPRVLDAMRRVPREAFVPEMERASSYANTPLPIGHRQTISQPLIVALMTHHLKLEPGNRVLEIGTGSGYQTAVLAELVDDIVTIETVPPLAEAAKDTLNRLGYRSLHFIQGDGRQGAPDKAPFDRILVTAAASQLPQALIDQLAPGGRLIAPVGESRRQDLILLTRTAAGDIHRKVLFPVAFVPLT